VATNDPIVGYYTEEELRKAAWIIGPSGAAARALQDAVTRREAGELVAFYRTRANCIVVGPDFDEFRDILSVRN